MGQHYKPLGDVDQLRRDEDYCTEAGALILARTINRYWQRRGFLPNVYAERQMSLQCPASDRARASFVIRSDMVGGRPR